MKDIDIIKLYFMRSEKAISKTTEKYGSYLRAIAMNILGNEQDSEECVNDTVYRAWKAIPPAEPENLRAYLGKIIRNLAFNRYNSYAALKRNGSTTQILLSELEECLPSDNTVEGAFDEKRLIKLIEEFLQKENEEKRNIFVCRYWYCQSLSEISEGFSMSRTKVSAILYRQRIRLKEFLEKEGVTV